MVGIVAQYTLLLAFEISFAGKKRKTLTRAPFLFLSLTAAIGHGARPKERR
jgi:hypothetical protein